jgi:hypothetical protein
VAGGEGPRADVVAGSGGGGGAANVRALDNGRGGDGVRIGELTKSSNSPSSSSLPNGDELGIARWWKSARLDEVSASGEDPPLSARSHRELRERPARTRAPGRLAREDRPTRGGGGGGGGSVNCESSPAASDVIRGPDMITMGVRECAGEAIRLLLPNGEFECAAGEDPLWRRGSVHGLGHPVREWCEVES